MRLNITKHDINIFKEGEARLLNGIKSGIEDGYIFQYMEKKYKYDILLSPRENNIKKYETIYLDNLQKLGTYYEPDINMCHFQTADYCTRSCSRDDNGCKYPHSKDEYINYFRSKFD